MKLSLKELLLMRKMNPSFDDRYGDLISPITISCGGRFFEWDGELTTASFEFMEDYFNEEDFSEGDEFVIGPFRVTVSEIDYSRAELLLERSNG